MTEAEWDVDESSERMLNFLAEQNASLRKLRLFAVSCCQRIQHVLTAEQTREAVAIAERYADGKATLEQLHGASEAVRLIANNLDGHFQNAADAILHCAEEDIRENVMPVTFCAVDALWITTRQDSEKERAVQPHFLRDIFGNPFRSLTIDPSWQTSTVVALAEGIYQDRAFDRMPILADALQDAGCDNEDILNHCRQPSEHVRGCWVVDLILGKS
jgi:hypothetical protein